MFREELIAFKLKNKKRRKKKKDTLFSDFLNCDSCQIAGIQGLIDATWNGCSRPHVAGSQHRLRATPSPSWSGCWPKQPALCLWKYKLSMAYGIREESQNLRHFQEKWILEGRGLDALHLVKPPFHNGGRAAGDMGSRWEACFPRVLFYSPGSS